ncbi:hypothetical protein [Marinomonas transparens]|uniref:Uncharacterized protein n=1 Tax=Marinomonas transparens TaxID=2795388 RepID=A0A934N0E6_9GAMM|nr:hypothetical protein [Marinomonas transparens]MBJ7536632.1 hypothetical protein [Marinomonas transparens]
MVSQKPKNPRKKYSVLEAYQCPNRKVWYAKGDVVELLSCEADFLILGGKVALATKKAIKQKGEA